MMATFPASQFPTYTLELSAEAASGSCDGLEAHTPATVVNGIVLLVLPSAALITATLEVTFPPLTEALDTYARLPSGRAAIATGFATEITTGDNASLDASK